MRPRRLLSTVALLFWTGCHQAGGLEFVSTVGRDEDARSLRGVWYSADVEKRSFLLIKDVPPTVFWRDEAAGPYMHWSRALVDESGVRVYLIWSDQRFRPGGEPAAGSWEEAIQKARRESSDGAIFFMRCPDGSLALAQVPAKPLDCSSRPKLVRDPFSTVRLLLDRASLVRVP